MVIFYTVFNEVLTLAKGRGMAKRMMVIIGMFLVVTAAMAKSKDESAADLIRIKTDQAQIFKAELSSSETEKLGNLSVGMEVQMLKQGKARSLVKAGALRGWVDNSNLEKIKGGGSNRSLKDIEVQGWLDNPSAVYILDNANSEVANLPLDRSFNSDIVEAKDREDVERTYDENK